METEGASPSAFVLGYGSGQGLSLTCRFNLLLIREQNFLGKEYINKILRAKLMHAKDFQKAPRSLSKRKIPLRKRRTY
jgi:hypothetical protein